MGYCAACGQQAKGRCMTCHREVCVQHQTSWLWGYVPATAMVAPFYGQEAQLQIPGTVTCVDCAHSNDAPVYAKLGQDLRTLGEQQAVAWIIALRLTERGFAGKPLPAAIVAQHAGLDGVGTRPMFGWVIKSLVSTRTPEVLTLHAEITVPARAGGLFRSAVPEHTKTEPLSSLTAWIVNYRDNREYSTSGSLLIHPSGMVIDIPYDTSELSNRKMILKKTNAGKEDAATLRSTLQGPAVAPDTLKMHCDECKVSATRNIADLVIGRR